ncbi:hypothetical protein ACUY29_11305 [Corynebacterium aurimucosum]
MSNPTRQEIIRAHEALNSLLKLASGTSTASAIFNWETVRAALPPVPRPTMADVEWDDDEHYLAEAETPDLVGKVVMLRKTESSLIEFTMTTCTPLTKGCTWPEKLTPTGKRYTLTEVQE